MDQGIMLRYGLIVLLQWNYLMQTDLHQNYQKLENYTFNHEN